jgi:hypothetical protein
MNQKLIIILVSCFLLASVLVVTLYAVSNKIVHEPGSFLRIYQKDAAIKSNEIDLGLNSWYIAGIADNHIYLGNLTQPLDLLITNLSLTDSQHVRITLRDLGSKSVYQKSRIRIASPYFYYADGITPALFRGRIGEWQADRLKFDSAYFDYTEIIGPASVAIRAHNLDLENVLGKVQEIDPKVSLAPDLLQKQLEGVFSTDGMLRYNTNLKRLIYTYYYRNEYVVYDTNLTLDYRGHTIDTFSLAQIKTAFVHSTKTHTLVSKKITNKESCTSGNYLFISSNLLAKNDFNRTFDLMALIDVYDLRNNTYRFSFSLPHYDARTKLREFRVYNDKFLIAIYDHYLVKFDFQAHIFEDEL